jgi:hypothetical protein
MTSMVHQYHNILSVAFVVAVCCIFFFNVFVEVFVRMSPVLRFDSPARVARLTSFPPSLSRSTELTMSTSQASVCLL